MTQPNPAKASRNNANNKLIMKAKENTNQIDVQTEHQKKTLTFGEFIASAYAVCGRQKAKEIVRLAVNAHWVEFRGKQRFMVS